MKFIRNARTSRIKERAFDLLTKALLIAFSTLVCLWMVSGAHAAQGTSAYSASMGQITGIKASPQADGSYTIDFELSQKVKPEQVQVEFERNFIQLSLRGVSAYPARTENINQASLEKVFTYQYQPDLSRARVLLKSAATSIKAKTSWEITETGVRLIVKDQGVAAASMKASTFSSNTGDSEEDRIVQEILSEVKPAGKAATAAATAEPAATTDTKKAGHSEEQPLFAAKMGTQGEIKEKESGAARVFASLLLVLGIIGASAVAYRRFVLGKGIKGFHKQPRVIEVISTQGLGPKRSVALIKVVDQYMVVGMAGDGMTLLANMGTDVKIEKFIDQSGQGPSFDDAFASALAGDSGAEKATGSGAVAATKAAMGMGIRSAIKKRIEGYKPL